MRLPSLPRILLPSLLILPLIILTLPRARIQVQALALAQAVSSNTLGINCRGSLLARESKAIWTFYTEDIPWTNRYDVGQHIACLGNTCIFPQGTQGYLSGYQVHLLLRSLYAHGCTSCGSIPLGYPENNNPAVDGMLTVNYVKEPNCSGIC